MIGRIASEMTQEYLNMATGDRWVVVLQDIIMQREETAKILVSVMARYLLPMDEVEITTPTPWPGGKLQEKFSLSETVPDANLMVRLEQEVEDLPEAREVRQELLRRVMNAIHRADVIGQMPLHVQEVLANWEE